MCSSDSIRDGANRIDAREPSQSGVRLDVFHSKLHRPDISVVYVSTVSGQKQGGKKKQEAEGGRGKAEEGGAGGWGLGGGGGQGLGG